MKIKMKLTKGGKSDVAFVRKEFWNKLIEVPGNIADDAVALYYYMLDSDVAWYKKVFVVGCLVYLINPFDFIPDFTPFVGYGDDAALIMMTVQYIGSELEDYY